MFNFFRKLLPKKKKKINKIIINKNINSIAFLSYEELEQLHKLLDNCSCYFILEDEPSSLHFCPLYTECDGGNKELCEKLKKEIVNG